MMNIVHHRILLKLQAPALLYNDGFLWWSIWSDIDQTNQY